MSMHSEAEMAGMTGVAIGDVSKETVREQHKSHHKEKEVVIHGFHIPESLEKVARPILKRLKKYGHVLIVVAKRDSYSQICLNKLIKHLHEGHCYVYEKPEQRTTVIVNPDFKRSKTVLDMSTHAKTVRRVKKYHKKLA